MSLLAMDAMNETFFDCEEAVREGVRRFCRRYRFDIEEALGLAHEAFCEAYWDFDKSRASFLHWVRTKVHYKLIEAYDRQAYRCSADRRADSALYLTRVQVVLDTVPRPEREWRLLDFLDELSPDAQHVVKIVLDSPGDIRLTLHEKGNCHARTVRAAIREFLRDCGWDPLRITAAFSDIQHALKN